jgi:hypothetical protein
VTDAPCEPDDLAFDFDERLRRLLTEYDHDTATAEDRYEAAIDLHCLLAVAEGKLPISTEAVRWTPEADGERTLPGTVAARLWPLVADLVEVDIITAVLRASSFLASTEFSSAPAVARCADSPLHAAAAVSKGEDPDDAQDRADLRAERDVNALAVQADQLGTAAGIVAQLYPLIDHMRGRVCHKPDVRRTQGGPAQSRGRDADRTAPQV